MAFVLSEDAEPIPGYRLVNRIGTGGYGEVWKVEAPGGLTKAIKVIYGHRRDARADQELRALDRIKGVRHPFLLSLERYEIIHDQVFIVTELADASLLDRYEECRRAGLPGIPRDELLSYLRDTADALDYMNEHYGLQHLDIKPQNLLLVAGRIKIADFGLVKDLQGTSATATGGVTPLYASPEAFDGKVSRFSDQYSLAIVYQEMLTGIRPFPGKTALQLAAQHLNSPPLLDPLPAPDRPVIARSLSKVPDQRFPTCREMAAQLLINQVAAPGPRTPQAPSVFRNDGSTDPEKFRSGPPAEPAVGEDEDVLGMDTLVADELPLRTPKTPLPAAPRRPEPVRRPIMPHAQGAGKLRPTLFLGLGGMGGWVLHHLRERFHLRFGDLTAVPIFRLLLIDTDRTALRLAHQGESGGGLAYDESFLVPLRRPEHYRAKSKDLLRWLDRRFLYGIPRSLTTEGKRHFGRLALVDNAADVLERLRDTLALLTSPEARAETAAATGLSLREEAPRIFVIAGISGGTGGGMVIDVAYALRQVLADLHLPDDGLCGLLVHATGYDTTERDRARINAYNTLTELNHFSRLDQPYPGDPRHGLNPAPPDQPPFKECYLVHLGDQLGQAQAYAATDPLAEYLYLDAVTPAGGFLDQYRQSTHPESYTGSGDTGLRTFGLCRLSFPRYALADRAAQVFCRQLIVRWQGDLPDRERERLKEEVPAQARAMGLDADGLANRFHAAAQAVWGEDPETYLQKTVGDWLPKDAQARPQAVSNEVMARTVEQIDNLLGSGREEGERTAPAPTPFEKALHDRAAEVRQGLDQDVDRWLAGLVEDSGKRLPAAEETASRLVRHLTSLIERTRSQLAECRATREAQRMRLLAGEPAAKAVTPGWLGVGRRTPAGGSGPAQRPVDYCWLRLKEIVLAGTLDALRSACRRASEFCEQVGLARQKLGHFAHMFEAAPTDSEAAAGAVPAVGVTELFPGQARNLGGAARELVEGLPPEFVFTFENRFQTDILNPQGGLWGLLSRNRDATEILRDELQIRASSAILDRLKDTDAAGLFLQTRPNPAEARQALADYVRQATPNLVTPEGWQHLVVGLPAGQAGDALREMVSQVTGGLPNTVLDSEGDVIVCCEAAQLPLRKLAAALIEHESSYADVARNLMTRVDVKWSFMSLDDS